jgi:hypothetical protein
LKLKNIVLKGSKQYLFWDCNWYGQYKKNVIQMFDYDVADETETTLHETAPTTKHDFLQIPGTNASGLLVLAMALLLTPLLLLSTFLLR